MVLVLVKFVRFFIEMLNCFRGIMEKVMVLVFLIMFGEVKINRLEVRVIFNKCLKLIMVLEK